MIYKISYKNPFNRLVNIELIVKNINSSYIDFQLPAWRPGRYELQNYAANVKQMVAVDENGMLLPCFKISRNLWRVNTETSKEIKLRYDYFAARMDAGGCWLDENQLYLNFICCAVYIPDRIHEPCEVQLSLPPDYKLACGLPAKGNTLNATDYYHLVDSPMLASADLKHYEYNLKNIPFHIWIQGENVVDESKLINDFTRFSELQLEMMGEFPEKDYHFIFQFLPYTHYHGVEHRNSTVVTLGPAKDIAKSEYENLLGISSHELFHAWNIIKIRPAELTPYDFTKENYFQTGFVAEGFTTYYGDLFLVQSGVFGIEEYLKTLNETIHKHFDNFGNFNLSLANSSMDLWVDGYSQGIPNRKVSIYVKGCVVALLLDLEIRNQTSFTKSLDDLMLLLWEKHGKTKVGYTMNDIVKLTENLTNCSMSEFFEKTVFGHTDLKKELADALGSVGCILKEEPALSALEKDYGIRFINRKEKWFISKIAPDSPAEKILSLEDEIIAINDEAVNLENINFTASEVQIKLTIKRWGKLVEVILENPTKNAYLSDYKIIINNNAGELEQKNLKKWLKL